MRRAMVEVSSDRWRKMRPHQKDKVVQEALAKRMKEKKPLSLKPTDADGVAAMSGGDAAPVGDRQDDDISYTPESPHDEPVATITATMNEPNWFYTRDNKCLHSEGKGIAISHGVRLCRTRAISDRAKR